MSLVTGSNLSNSVSGSYSPYQDVYYAWNPVWDGRDLVVGNVPDTEIVLGQWVCVYCGNMYNAEITSCEDGCGAPKCRSVKEEKWGLVRA